MSRFTFVVDLSDFDQFQEGFSEVQQLFPVWRPFLINLLAGAVISSEEEFPDANDMVSYFLEIVQEHAPQPLSDFAIEQVDCCISRLMRKIADYRQQLEAVRSHRAIVDPFFVQPIGTRAFVIHVNLGTATAPLFQPLQPLS